MIFKICKILLVLLALNSTAYAQTTDDVQKQQEEFVKKLEADQEERTNLFVSQLKADDFQKEIIKQKINSFYQEKKAIYLNNSLKYYERDDQVASLENSHFSDIKDLISEDNMTQINSFIKDNQSVLKKEKKKNKKRNKHD